ncbi:hypothetical protein [Natronorubrum sediminis]|nr:hypothetical protein [Natronorubrum sediminis]
MSGLTGRDDGGSASSDGDDGSDSAERVSDSRRTVLFGIGVTPILSPLLGEWWPPWSGRANETEETDERGDTSGTDGDDAGSSAGSLERLRPPDRDLTVQPGTQIMFEVSAEAGLGQTTEWLLDGEREDISMGPWESAYIDHQGADIWLHTVESEGEIGAEVDDDGDVYTTSWDVSLDSDGVGSPSITDSSPPQDELGDLDEYETIEFEVSVSDSDGNLDQVVWWVRAADVVYDVTSVSGREDTASISPDADELVPEGVVAWVLNESGGMVESEVWEFGFPTPESEFGIETVDTNSPISSGETLEVEATIQNTGDSTGTTDVDLVVGHDPELADSESVELDSGDAATLTLTFEAGDPAGESEEFPGVIETADDESEFQIVVEDAEPTPATFDVQELSTNAPVSAGETIETEATVRNVGDETGTTDVELVVGHDPVVEDSELLTLEPEEEATLRLPFEAGDPAGESESFPIEVDTGADSATEMVVVTS